MENDLSEVKWCKHVTVRNLEGNELNFYLYVDSIVIKDSDSTEFTIDKGSAIMIADFITEMLTEI